MEGAMEARSPTGGAGTPTGGVLSRRISESSLRKPGRRSTVDVGTIRSESKKRHSFLSAQGAKTLGGSNSRRGSLAQAASPQSRKNSVDEYLADNAEQHVEADAQPPKEPSLTENAPVLAWKYKLELYETQVIMIQFAKTKRNAVGGIDFPDFYKFCCAIFDLKSVSEDVVHRIIENTGMDKYADLEKFLQWYMTNMFSSMVMLTASPEKAASEKLVSKLARDHGVGSSDIDNIKRAFDKYDKDTSGFIDKDEFTHMLYDMLKIKDTSHMPQRRIDKFWQEIDTDGSGEVDFSEFAEWYLKYFNPESTKETGSCNLIEAFYASFNPDNQRRWVKEKQEEQERQVNRRHTIE